MRYLHYCLTSARWPSGVALLFAPRRGQLRPASTSSRPDFAAIDAKWQDIWEQQRSRLKDSVHRDESKDGVKTAKYVLPMFPYPSGTLHMGHIRVYTISDVIARYHRMKGTRVVHPIGWDAFGLPAENAAIERGVDPGDWTIQNIKQMKAQLKSMNGEWDWDRELATCDPAYYKHTQLLFLKLHKAGLAYQKEALVNWDPIDHTVLANEQVDANGRSWRSGAKVEQRMLKQWFLATTHYAEELYSDLLKLENDNMWPARVVDMQKNWLGRSIGVRFPFELEVPYSRIDGARSVLSTFRELEVFTTRLDTLYGVQFVALSLSHPLVQAFAEHDKKLQEFIKTAKHLPENSKDGYLLPFVAKNKLLGVRRISIYAAPYVLDGYGTGAVMGVPAHDARDNAFWHKHRPNEDIICAIEPRPGNETKFQGLFTGEGISLCHGTSWDGKSSPEAKLEILQQLKMNGYNAYEHTTWRLRDWLISRQRYWGAPIPIVHCNLCGSVPVPLEELPVQLPKLSADHFQRREGNPLESAKEWVSTSCPKCKQPARRDTDTMDTFMDSAWYFLRFTDPQNHDIPFLPEKASSLMPVDYYIGGVEHAILHLLYARFMAKFLASEEGGRSWPTSFTEPFSKLVTQGMVHGKTYSDPVNGRFLKAEEVDTSVPSAPVIKATGAMPNISFEKMSKSKHNGVDPAACLARYGADVTRAHILFAAPEGEVLNWEEERIIGMTRWLTKVWRLVNLNAGQNATLNFETDIPSLADSHKKILAELRTTSDSVEEKIRRASGLNTVVSDLIKFTNTLDSYTGSIENAVPQDKEVQKISRYAVESLVKLMAPLTPAFSEECWQLLHSTEALGSGKRSSTYTSLFDGSVTWPAIPFGSESKFLKPIQTFVVSCNGKVRFTVRRHFEHLPAAEDDTQVQGWLEKNIFSSAEAMKWLETGRNSDMFAKRKMIFCKRVNDNRWIVNVSN
ncbi:leucine-tRNA ligase [Verruconis gallopava]|uniref:leucine--tRNA ligase n=1 Tax=Verruconis gallopava TaxID=253628 RepID=A0A0D1YGL2_9PEZI|nr:leucine-tRNA ligase [Verruconis gallopava]KIV99931.1 leucine-tRNA ligase [Verruconis gallopava]